MKKVIWACIVVAMALASCAKDVVKTISVSVNISEAKIEEGVPTPEAYEVVFTNVATNQATTVTSENGVATAPQIIPGVYNVSATASATADGFSYNIAGSLSSVNFATEGQVETLEVQAVKSSALVFKEIYFSGVPDYYFRDQFYEVYNNSDQTVYVDKMCICESVFATYDVSQIYSWEIENPEKYIFAQTIWQLPGNGTEYPVKPGESIIIAQWGTNHQIATLNPNSPVDLSGSEFEAIEAESTLWNGIVITDGSAKNMAKVVNALGYDVPQWLTTVSGSRYVIFFPEGELKNSDFIVAEGTSTQAREIPMEWVVDAVEAIADETCVSKKGLPTVLDSGYIWVSGSYSGESISRKISETKDDGRVVYQDTNNTTNDFEVQKPPVIRRNNAGVPSWNTWIK
ncbi:MAG: DUF4876 domain-containing protein [Tidjanibacter sp.]|nr:DUF4876 domain-containing protein [Tidjanibacter sp.]